MSGPSDRAVYAAECADAVVRAEAEYAASRAHSICSGSPAKMLQAAHDPALGLDRSVCLRDVCEALEDGSGWRSAADFLAREFGSTT